MVTSGEELNFVNGVTSSIQTQIDGKQSSLANQGTQNTVLHGNASGDPSFSAVDLAADVTGVTHVSNGGTNSSVALNNDRIMVSNGGAIVESSPLSNGQLLIGSTGASPAVSNIIAGKGIDIINGAGTINVSASVANAFVTTDRSTNSTSVADVPDMSFTIGANETWSFEFYIQNNCSGNAGTKWAISVPSGGSFRALVKGNDDQNPFLITERINASGTLTTNTFNADSDSDDGWTEIKGVVINGTTPGNVKLQFANGGASQTTTVLQYSYLTARKID